MNIRLLAEFFFVLIGCSLLLGVFIWDKAGAWFMLFNGIGLIIYILFGDTMANYIKTLPDGSPKKGKINGRFYE